MESKLESLLLERIASIRFDIPVFLKRGVGSK